uniref:Chemokine interleukin-8-like domain-containing protein n=1 Tax=Salmo trutta TaxID=8032 RepID=A0A674B8A9_SALTR
MLSAADVSKTLRQVNIHKAAGPDGLPECVLRACADQLASVFTDIFNLSLYESVIPTCFKQTTIVHVPKNTKVTCLNDYRPVALTSVAMKCFERLYQRRIPKQLIVAYEMTRSDCTHKGVMLITKKNYPICANPDEPLIDRIMKAIDESKFK